MYKIKPKELNNFKFKKGSGNKNIKKALNKKKKVLYHSQYKK